LFADRQGFTQEAIAEIFFLKQLHALLYPQAPGDPSAAATDTMTERMRPRSVQELAQWYPARGARPAVAPGELGAAKPAAHGPGPVSAHHALTDTLHAAKHWQLIDCSDDLRQLLQRRAPGQLLLTPSKAKLGEILVERGLMTREQIDRALEMQRNSAVNARPLLGQLLARLGAASEEDVARALCVQEGVPLVDLDRLDLSADARSKSPFDLARQHRAIPVMRVGTLLALRSRIRSPSRPRTS